MRVTSIGALVVLVATVAAAAAEQPGPDNDYGRAQIGGSQGGIVWESLLQGEGLEGWEINGDKWTPDAWSREGDTIIADVGEGNRARIVTGDDTWRAYELKVQMTVVQGGSAQLWFNIHDGQAYHFAPLLGWQTAAIMAPGHDKLDVVNHVFEVGREYDVVLAVRSKSVTTYIDGQLVNRVTLAEEARGGIGLAVWGRHSVSHFRDPKVRHYYRARPAGHTH